MRQKISSGSVKGFYLDREEVFRRLQEVCKEALRVFPEIRDIRLFGSFAQGEETGLSDIDLFLIVDTEEKNPIERMRPYFKFFSSKIEVAIDMIVISEKEVAEFRDIIKSSISLQ